MQKTIHKTVAANAAATGKTRLGFIAEAFPGATVEVARVVLEQVGAADANINLELAGNKVFASDISVSAAGTAEGHTPDQNEYAADETDALEADVTTASSTTSSTYDMTVVLKIHGETHGRSP